MRRLALVLATLFLYMSYSTGFAQSEFAEGHIWSIKSAVPSTARIVIGRIEPWRGTIVVHISVIDIPPTTAGPRGNSITKISHMPFEKAALEKSVGSLLSTGALPDPKFEMGYQHWKDSNGGVYTIPISQVLNLGGDNSGAPAR